MIFSTVTGARRPKGGFALAGTPLWGAPYPLKTDTALLPEAKQETFL
jgi:hypothetical protein